MVVLANLPHKQKVLCKRPKGPKQGEDNLRQFLASFQTYLFLFRNFILHVIFIHFGSLLGQLNLT